MTHRFVVTTSTIIVIFSLVLSLMSVGDAKDKRDVVEEAPENQQQSSHFNIHIFLKMQDPRQAAVLMLEDARKHGVDIDAIHQREVTPGRIRLPYATIEPTEGDRSFVETISRSESKSEVPDELMCVVQFSRFCSVRETAGILSLGVRLFTPLHTYGRIAKIPADQLETLLDLPYVKWIGPYLPSYKYNASYNYDYDWYFSVSAFIEDEDIIRADLMAIGVEISMRRGRYTTIKMTDGQLVELASIWWVEKIHQSPRMQDSEVPGAGYGALPQFNQHYDFNACDSRKLVSMRNPLSQWRGKDVMVGILDSGCHWESHEDLEPNADNVLSDGSEAILHGTHVAGIVCGMFKNFDDGDDWVAGVAGGTQTDRGATFVFQKSSKRTLEDAVYRFYSNQVLISNHSHGWYPDSLDAYYDYRYSETARYFDELTDDGDILFVASAGNDSTRGITGPAVGKNVLSVGAIRYVPQEYGDTLGTITAYSSMGPTKFDKRLKPDLVAPGGAPGMGAYGRGVVSTDDRGYYSYDWLTEGGNVYDYTRRGGTSMAAPFVTGAAAVISEWYKWFRKDTDLPVLSSELLKAMLINTAIPLTWNGDEPSRGYANTRYGYGLVNVYSVLDSPTDEIKRIGIFAGTLNFVEDSYWHDIDIPLCVDSSGNPVSPSYLVATMVYDDYSAQHECAANTLYDSLTFSINGFGVDNYLFTVPPICSTGATIQKIMIPDPGSERFGNAKVTFVGTKYPGGYPPPQDYAVVVDVMYGVPELAVETSIVTPLDSIRINEPFKIKVKVTNVGSNVAAGVTAKVDGPLLWSGGDCGKPKYLDNLVKNGASSEAIFEVKSLAEGPIDIIVEVDGINKLLPRDQYPVIDTLRVPNVQRFFYVSGYAKSKPLQDGNEYGISGVVMDVEGVTQEVITDSFGHYKVRVDNLWDKSITPGKNGSVFKPHDYDFEPVVGDSIKDFEVEVYEISGWVENEARDRVQGIEVRCYPDQNDSLLSVDGITNGEGEYKVFVERNWCGEVAPASGMGYAGFVLEQGEQSFCGVSRDYLDTQNYVMRWVTEWEDNGIPVSTYAIGTKYTPRVVSDDAGGGLYVWGDDRSGDQDILAAHMIGEQDGSGFVDWQDLVVCGEIGTQKDPVLLSVGDGEAVVAWLDNRNGNYDIYMQKFDKFGNLMWISNGVPVCTNVEDQSHLSLVPSDGKNVILTWYEGSWGGRVQKVDTNGNVLWDVDLNGYGQESGLIPTSNGGAYVAYVAAGGNVRVHKLDGNGNIEWDEHPWGFRIAREDPGVLRQFCLVECNDNSIIIIYQIGGYFVYPASDYYVKYFATKLDENANFVWEPNTVLVADGGDAWDRFRAVSDDNGGVFAIWARNVSPYQYGDCRRLYMERINNSGQVLWNPSGLTGVEVTPDRQVPENQRAISALKDGFGGAYICWEKSETQDPQDSPWCDIKSNTKDVLAQHIDGAGDLLWGRGGIELCNATLDQRYPRITVDRGNAVLACWEDKRSGGSDIYSIRLNEDNTRYTVSGTILDELGAGYDSVEVKLTSTDPFCVEDSVTTDTTGVYLFIVKPFWAGRVTPEATGHISKTSPSYTEYSNVAADITTDYRFSHEATNWKSTGLVLTPLESDAQQAPSLTRAEASEAIFVWPEFRSCSVVKTDLFMHKVDSSGDLLWTYNGHQITNTTYIEENPKLCPSSNGTTIIIWTRNTAAVPLEYHTPGIGMQKVDAYGNKIWGEDGFFLEWSEDVKRFGAIADGVGGVYVAWYDEINGEILMQRIDNGGNFVWQQPILVEPLVDPLLADPILLSDYSNGVIVVWHRTLYGDLSRVDAQRVNFAGNNLWGGGLAITVSGAKYIPDGFVAAISDGMQGTYVSWTECNGSPLSMDRTAKVQWINSTGEQHWGPPDWGYPVISTGGASSLRDIAIDEEEGFFVIVNTDTGLVGQNILPDPDPQGNARLWGDGGQIISTNYGGQTDALGRTTARIIDSGTATGGGSIVIWTGGNQGSQDLLAQKLGRAGRPMWDGPAIVVCRAPGFQYPRSLVSDGAGGAFVSWAEDGNVIATRVSEAALAQIDVDINSYGRYDSLTYFSMADTSALGCPQGDYANIVVFLEITGDLMTAIPEDSITLSQPDAGIIEFFGPVTADSVPVLDDGVYKTTITVECFSGCGRDSAMVKINGIDRGYAYLYSRSPDLNNDSFSRGHVDLMDFSEFCRHYPSTACDCIYEAEYEMCVDYSPPQDSTVDLIDYSVFVSHYGHLHEAQGGSSPRAIVYSDATVELGISEENPLQGRRLLNVAVKLKNVEKYSALIISLKDDNPLFEFVGWQQDPSYPNKTMCAEVVRNGQREIVIGAIGSKSLDSYSVNLGEFEIEVNSKEPLKLTDNDFSLVVADLLEIGGDALVFRGSQVHRDLTPAVYRYQLSQNYPNPFNPTTTIAFSIAEDSNVDLRIYDVTGALVKTLIDDPRRKNNYKIVWDGQNNQGSAVASGVYFYRLVAADFSATKKMVLLR